MRIGIEGLAGDLASQRASFGDKTPAYDRLLLVLGELLESGHGCAAVIASAFASRTFVAAYDRPLLVLASLRHEAMRLGPVHPLHRAIAAEPPDPRSITREAVAAAFETDPEGLRNLLATRYVQTNETRRAVAWLWPASLAGCSDGGRPLALVDIGASAGLNLVADALPALWSDAEGAPLPVAQRLDVRARVGLDARPLDVGNDADAAWLRACIWPGDVARQRRLEEAIAAWRMSPAHVEPADIRDVPAHVERVLGTTAPDTLVIAYQTVVREYLPRDAAAAYADAMRALVDAASGRLAWIELETANTPDTQLPAALTAHVCGPRGAEALELARCHWHPSTLRVDRAATERFTHATRAL